jgi:hypothetical protein
MTTANEIDNTISVNRPSPSPELSWNDSAALVVRLYQIAFNRVPDKGGFEHWQRYLNEVADANTHPRTLADHFCQSREFRDKNGNTRSRDLIETLARNARAQSHELDPQFQAKLDAFSNQIDDSMTAADVLLRFADLPEVTARLQPHTEAFLDRAHKGTERYIGRLFERIPEPLPVPQPQIAAEPTPDPASKAGASPPADGSVEPETGRVYQLTLDDDRIVGTVFDDVFRARLVPLASGSPQRSRTLSDSDNLVGGDGWDELQLDIGLTSVKPTLSGIEEIRIKARPEMAPDEKSSTPFATGAHFDAGQTTGMRVVWNDGSTCPLVISGLTPDVEVGVRHTPHATVLKYTGQSQPSISTPVHIKVSGQVTGLDMHGVRNLEMKVEGGTHADVVAPNLTYWSVSGTGAAWFDVPNQTARGLKLFKAKEFDGDLKLSLESGPNLSVLSDAPSNHIVLRGNARNTVMTGSGHDWLETFGGPDRIDAGAGANVIFPGSGTDTIVISAAANSTLTDDYKNLTTVYGFKSEERDTIDFAFLTRRNLVGPELQAKIQEAVDQLGRRATLQDALDIAVDVQGVGKHKIGWFTFGPHFDRISGDPLSKQTGPHTYVFVDNDERTLVRLAGPVQLTPDSFFFDDP